MHQKKFFTLLLTCLLIACLALPCMALNVAADSADPAPQTTGNLTISYIYDEYKPLQYACVSLHQTATIDGLGVLTNTADFTEFNLLAYDLNTQDGLIAARDALEHYICLHGLDASHTATTDYTGEARIELPLGLYYVTTDPVFCEAEATTYTAGDICPLAAEGFYTESFLVLVGGIDPETGELIYDYVALPKISIVSVGEEDDSYTQDLVVEKIWKNTAHTTLPAQLEITLYRDGEAFDTAILNAKNGWRYTWEAMDASHTWAVTEATSLKDYTVHYASKVQDDKYVFTITNTFTGKPDPSPTPNPSTPPPPTPPNKPSLPQTGSNLPYVPICAGLGIGLLALGIVLNKGEKGGDDKCR